MRLSLAVLASATLLSTAAMADPLANVYDNTLKVTAGGETVDWHINKDGTFTTSSGVSGTWALKGEEICVTIGGAENCNPIEARNIGDTWTEPDGQGGTRSATLVAGR